MTICVLLSGAGGAGTIEMIRSLREIGRYRVVAIDASPYPFAVAVLIAASAAYSTPVSTPVVTLVVDPGRYKFTDFMKVGVPLLFLTYLATLAVAPMIFPFYPA